MGVSTNVATAGPDKEAATRALSTELTHLLIEPLVETLKQAILNKNSAL